MRVCFSDGDEQEIVGIWTGDPDCSIPFVYRKQRAGYNFSFNFLPLNRSGAKQINPEMTHFRYQLTKLWQIDQGREREVYTHKGPIQDITWLFVTRDS